MLRRQDIWGLFFGLFMVGSGIIGYEVLSFCAFEGFIWHFLAELEVRGLWRKKSYDFFFPRWLAEKVLLSCLVRILLIVDWSTDLCNESFVKRISLSFLFPLYFNGLLMKWPILLRDYRGSHQQNMQYLQLAMLIHRRSIDSQRIKSCLLLRISRFELWRNSEGIWLFSFYVFCLKSWMLVVLPSSTAKRVLREVDHGQPVNRNVFPEVRANERWQGRFCSYSKTLSEWSSAKR